MEYLKDTTIYKLLFVQKKLVSAVRSDFVDVDITHENYISLHFIYENPGITQAELAELNTKDRNVIVKTVDRLEKNGWVKRVRSMDDRRAFTLFATDSGKEIIHRYWDKLVQRQKEALSVLTEEEQRILDTLLEKVLG
ncbi:MAG: MarR family transcriptional regulator [Lachnospiraceae bacterium]|nr:MarR family transcriptional regulator [Lachnospiraceae bacterium]